MAQAELESLIRRSWTGTPDSEEWQRIAEAVVATTLDWELEQGNSEAPEGRHEHIGQMTTKIVNSTAQHQMVVCYRAPTQEVAVHQFSAVVPDPVVPLRVVDVAMEDKGNEPPHSLVINPGSVMVGIHKIDAGRDISFSDNGESPTWMGAGARCEYLNLDKPYMADEVAVGAGEISELFTGLANTEGVHRERLLGALFHVGALGMDADLQYLACVPDLRPEAEKAISRSVAYKDMAAALSAIQAKFAELARAQNIYQATNSDDTPWVWLRPLDDLDMYSKSLSINRGTMTSRANFNDTLAGYAATQATILDRVTKF
jgi:hypothetical protein